MTRWRAGALLFCFALSAAPGAFAMHVRNRMEIVAWSDDGESALLRFVERGPEGGGSESYRLVTLHPPLEANFLLSSDFSEGAHKKQLVSPSLREERLRELRGQLSKRGFHVSEAGGLSFPDSKPGISLEAIAKGEQWELREPGQRSVLVSCAEISDHPGWIVSATSAPNRRSVVVIASNEELGIETFCGLSPGSHAH